MNGLSLIKFALRGVRLENPIKIGDDVIGRTDCTKFFTEKNNKVKLTILGSQFDCDKLTPQKESKGCKRVILTPTTRGSLLLVREHF